jgi:CheY-like chemotaxis protein
LQDKHDEVSRVEGAATYERRTPAQLRHALRTPLNHIIGYAEMMLEDLRDSVVEQQPGLANELSEIVFNARELVKFIQNGLPPDRNEVRPTALQNLQLWLKPHVYRLVENLGAAQAAANPELRADLGRMRIAVEALLAFTEDRPLAADEVAPAEESAPADRVNAGRILIVDDSAVNRDILRRNLLREGYQVSMASDGRAALDLLRHEPFDLVLLDVLMPGMSGLEVLQEIKREPVVASIPVIMISALDESSSVVRCLGAGAEDYFMKPFDPILLRSRIRSALERSKLEQFHDLIVAAVADIESNSPGSKSLEAARPDEIIAFIHRVREIVAGFRSASDAGLAQPARK